MTLLLRSRPVSGVFALALFVVPPSEGSARPAPSKVEWTRPPALKAGDTIAFVAPAGPADPDKVRAAKERFERMGFRVRVGGWSRRAVMWTAWSGTRACPERAAFRASDAATSGGK
jgi:hypothetical protein